MVLLSFIPSFFLCYRVQKTVILILFMLVVQAYHVHYNSYCALHVSIFSICVWDSILVFKTGGLPLRNLFQSLEKLRTSF